MTWCRIWHHRPQSTFFSSVLWCLVARQTRTRSSAGKSLLQRHSAQFIFRKRNMRHRIFFFCPIRQLHEAICLPWASREVLILSLASACLLIYSLTNVHYPRVRWILVYAILKGAYQGRDFTACYSSVAWRWIYLCIVWHVAVCVAPGSQTTTHLSLTWPIDLKLNPPQDWAYGCLFMLECFDSICFGYMELTRHPITESGVSSGDSEGRRGCVKRRKDRGD